VSRSLWHSLRVITNSGIASVPCLKTQLVETELNLDRYSLHRRSPVPVPVTFLHDSGVLLIVIGVNDQEEMVV